MIDSWINQIENFFSTIRTTVARWRHSCHDFDQLDDDDDFDSEKKSIQIFQFCFCQTTNEKLRGRNKKNHINILMMTDVCSAHRYTVCDLICIYDYEWWWWMHENSLIIDHLDVIIIITILRSFHENRRFVSVVCGLTKAKLIYHLSFLLEILDISNLSSLVFGTFFYGSKLDIDFEIIIVDRWTVMT